MRISDTIRNNSAEPYGFYKQHIQLFYIDVYVIIVYMSIQKSCSCGSVGGRIELLSAEEIDGRAAI